ncbi:VWA domain-containing protein [Dermacoccaceae bacterium W4C1]
MEGTIHRFVRFLRLAGMRISVTETLDAVQAAGQPGIITDRGRLKAALSVALVKDRRDLAVFEEVFERYFGLLVVTRRVVDHAHAYDDLRGGGDVEEFTLTEDADTDPQLGHSHGKPADVKDFFKPEDMATQYNLSQEANKLDMASLSNDVVLADDARSTASDAARVQVNASTLTNPGMPGELSTSEGLALDVDLSVEEEAALLNWLGEGDIPGEDNPEEAPDLAALRERLRPLLDALPEALRANLREMLAAETDLLAREQARDNAPHDQESERLAFEEALQRLLRSLRGAPRPRRHVSGSGVIDPRRTMRSNMKYDGIPFRPVLVRKSEDRPRLVVLCDVSLSVRATSAFALHLVHSLQSLASQVRSFAFAAECAEVTDLFADHHVGAAVVRVLSGTADGGKIDVDADSDYGSCFSQFLEEFGSAVTHRTTVIVIGDGRGNGNDPGLSDFAEIARRARSVVWLTPEPRYSWALGRCDLPMYAEHCERVEVVRNLHQLGEVSEQLLEGTR